MSYFEQNIECLKNHYIEVYEKMYGADREDINPQELEFLSETALNGEKTLSVQLHGKYYRMNSSYSPSHEAHIWAEQYELTNLNHIVTMFGLGNGFFARELIAKLKKEDRLFIYEPSRDIFEYVMQEYDLTDILINKKVILSIEGINEFDFHNVLQYSLNLTNLYSIIRCMHPQYEELFTESCIIYWKEIRDLMFYTQININTEVSFGPRFLVNCFNNMKYLKDSYILRDIAIDLKTDIPAIIVAAGPSVKDELENLKKAKGRAYIFAVDRILDYLLDEGVQPDFVVTVDPVKPLKYFSRRDDVKIPLLTELASNWEILEAHKGEKIFFNCNSFFRQMYDAAGKYQPFIMTGASVATVAFSVCVHVGFQTIVLVGHDLAYDGNVTHAGGVAEDPSKTYDYMVEGIDGKEVRSRHDWNEFIRWYKDMIHMFPDHAFIDTKSKGAKIHGTVLMPFGEVLEKYGAIEDRKITQLYSGQRKSFNDESFKKACGFLRDSLRDLEKIKKKAKEAFDLCDIQINAYSRNPKDNKITFDNYKRISKINKFIESRPVYDLVDNIITSMNADDLSSIYKITDNAKNDKINTYQKSKNMYRATIDGVEYILPKLKKAIDEIDKK